MKALIRTGFLVLSAVLVASPSGAQSNSTSDSDRIQKLLQRIDQLEACQKAMQEKIAGSRLVVLPQSGHMTFVDQPSLFIDSVERFLDGR